MTRPIPAPHMPQSPALRHGGTRALGVPVLLFAGLLSACSLFGGGETAAPPTPVAIPAQQEDVLGPVSADSRLYTDNTGGYGDSARIVIRDGDAWAAAWDRATSHQANPLSRPAVDFTQHMVLVVAAGRMTPEDQIRVDSVGTRTVLRTDGSREDVLAVVVNTTEGCGRLDVDAYPVEIVRVPQFEGRVEFIERRRRDCPGGEGM